MMNRNLFGAIAVLAISACGQPTETPASNAAPDANAIAKSSIIVDTHIDVPYRISAIPADISEATESGDFDYPRAVSGGLNAPFMSIYTPAELEAEGRSREVAEQLIDLVESFVERSPEKFAIARSPSDVREQFAAGIMSLPLGMENGSPWIQGVYCGIAANYFR